MKLYVFFFNLFSSFLYISDMYELTSMKVLNDPKLVLCSHSVRLSGWCYLENTVGIVLVGEEGGGGVHHELRYCAVHCDIQHLMIANKIAGDSDF